MTRSEQTKTKHYKLRDLNEGDRFKFVKPKNEKVKSWVVEGQYPVNHITTVFSEKSGEIKNEEPIAVRDSHEVILIKKSTYEISHQIKKQ